MGVIPEKKDYKNASDGLPESVAKQLMNSGYKYVSHVKHTERSHFDRYGFVKDQKRSVMVYDVKAKILSITAFEEQFAEIKAICDNLLKDANVSDSKASEKREQQSQSSDKKSENKKVKSVTPSDSNKKVKAETRTDLNKKAESEKSENLQHSKVKEPRKKNNLSEEKKSRVREGTSNQKTRVSVALSNNNQPCVETNDNGDKHGDDRAKTKNVSINANQKSEKTSVKRADAKEEIKNDFTLKKYSSDRLESCIENLKRNKIKIKIKETQGTATEIVNIYEISSEGNKITARYMPHKKILQIQGKSGDFLRKIQTVFSESVDFKSALNAHIEQKQTDTKAADVEKQLKKYLPTGIMFLSSQAKIDFSIGIVDLLPGEIVLSDYSSLLIPPYRGLEMLIFDLQRAQGIKVKMIGQAFEKDADGNYVLKSSYRRKIGSVVFAEVMASLYTEYNSTRNFYVHSAYGPQTKVIADKNQAIAIYERMLNVVEYNSKKLKEIGFSL